MKKNKSLSAGLLALLIIVSGFHYKAKGQVMEKWNGSVSFFQKVIGPYITINEKRVEVFITDSKVNGTAKWTADHSITTAAGTVVMKTECKGSGVGELHAVDIDELNGDYYIHVISPLYTCIATGYTGTSTFEETSDITISDHRSGTNRNVLSGIQTTTIDMGGGMKNTTIISWYLIRGPIDAELIVTPSDYNIWLPKPGRDELSKGSVMDIALKVQGRNGRSPSLEAVRFELHLSNTSKEPGITLNAPLRPSSNQLPDLRFLPHSIGESIEEDQFIEINCEDGKTGKATIGSYDGGGWTTLTAIAVLQGGIRIEGTLLVPGGIKEISIPKRNPGSNIATAWLTANGNPGEIDDKEKRTGNPYIGDGLTAYEEYRGVISQGQFLRLKANEKELGVLVKKSEVTLFAEGVTWLENASGLKIIRFDETEINTDRRLNKNFQTAHDYDQYVLKLENTGLTGDVMGENQPENVKEKVPKQSDLVAIDVNKIKSSYQNQAAAVRAANMSMPYTEEEDLANTVAHELGHGIHIIHHGKSSAVPPRKAYANSNPPFHIYWINSNTEETTRPYPAGANDYLETTGIDSCDASGDLSCIIAYTSLYNWAFRISKADGSLYYYKVPLLPVGKKLCTSKTGTGINAPSNRGVNNVNKYFGDAENGECLNQIKLK